MNGTFAVNYASAIGQFVRVLFYGRPTWFRDTISHHKLKLVIAVTILS